MVGVYFHTVLIEMFGSCSDFPTLYSSCSDQCFIIFLYAYIAYNYKFNNNALFQSVKKQKKKTKTILKMGLFIILLLTN